jgi:hypothetical protein
VLVYRIYPHLDGVAPDAPGGPMYLHKPQGYNRADNPDLYDAWYFGLTPECAVGEVFGNLAEWSPAMFSLPALPGSQKVLGVYEIDETKVPLLDLDDASALAARGLRPTQVVSRNYPVTQGWARSIYMETNPGIGRKWEGIRWWSFHRPHWTTIVLWGDAIKPAGHQFVRYEPLDTSHPAVLDAARSLAKPIKGP